ncbi:hypothetical protein L932_01715 [Helicobacter pylori PZ5026]|nr:hypothetical protein L932_01715 [Helicobacter pylori PZ5026]
MKSPYNPLIIPLTHKDRFLKIIACFFASSFIFCI